MDANPLYPPNDQQLTDDVVGLVMLQRSMPSSRNNLSQKTALVDSSAHAGTLSTKKTVGRTKKNGRGKRSTPPKTEHAADSTRDNEEQRRRHCASQARYRQKTITKTITLESQVQKLRSEIIRLKMHRQLFYYRAPMQSTPWSMATQYFNVFRYGYNVPIPGPTTIAKRETFDAHVQRDFLLKTMASDVSVSNGTKVGVKAMLEDMSLVAICYEGMETELVRLERGPGDFITATVTTTSTINENTLRYVFPRLFDGSNNAKWPSLNTKLLGRQFVMDGLVHFEWNAENNCVITVRYDADMLTSLLGILGNLVDVSRAFHDTVIDPASRELSAEIYSHLIAGIKFNMSNGDVHSQSMPSR